MKNPLNSKISFIKFSKKITVGNVIHKFLIYIYILKYTILLFDFFLVSINSKERTFNTIYTLKYHLIIHVQRSIKIVGFLPLYNAYSFAAYDIFNWMCNSLQRTAKCYITDWCFIQLQQKNNSRYLIEGPFNFRKRLIVSSHKIKIRARIRE